MSDHLAPDIIENVDFTFRTGKTSSGGSISHEGDGIYRMEFEDGHEYLFSFSAGCSGYRERDDSVDSGKRIDHDKTTRFLDKLFAKKGDQEPNGA